MEEQNQPEQEKDKLKDKGIHNKSLKIAIIAGIIIIAGSVLYYFVYYLPKERRADQLNLDTCLIDAKTSKSERWDKNCEAKGKEKECLQTENVAVYLAEAYQADRDACFKQFSPN